MPSAHYTIKEHETHLQFTFPSREQDSQTIFFVGYIFMISSCLGLCAASVFTDPQALSRRFEEVQFQWVAIAWFVGFISILLIVLLEIWAEVLWRLAGREIVEISAGTIRIRHRNLFIGWSKSFATSQIRCIFVSRLKITAQHPGGLASLKDRRFWSFRRGKLAFKYGSDYFGRGNFYRFAPALDADEAEKVLETICKKYPQFKCPEKKAG